MIKVLILRKELEKHALPREFHVEFKNGKYYIYADIPMPIWEELRAAKSVGKYFAWNIRGVYEGEKV